MSQENVELVETLYDAWNRTGGKPRLDLIDPEIVVEVMDGNVLEGRYLGHAGVLEVLDGFWGVFQDIRIDAEEVLPAGDEVVLTVRYYGRGRSSGVAVDMRAWHVWGWRDGKAVRWLVLATKAEALEAAGLGE